MIFVYFCIRIIKASMTKRKIQVKKLFTAGFMMAVFLFFLKYLPEKIFGKEILYDASFHITIAFFLLYLFWFFIDQNKDWRVPYFIFSALVIFIIAVQRILVDAHNDLGLLLGVLISIVSIFIAERRTLRNKISF